MWLYRGEHQCICYKTTNPNRAGALPVHNGMHILHTVLQSDYFAMALFIFSWYVLMNWKSLVKKVSAQKYIAQTNVLDLAPELIIHFSAMQKRCSISFICFVLMCFCVFGDWDRLVWCIAQKKKENSVYHCKCKRKYNFSWSAMFFLYYCLPKCLLECSDWRLGCSFTSLGLSPVCAYTASHCRDEQSGDYRFST